MEMPYRPIIPLPFMWLPIMPGPIDPEAPLSLLLGGRALFEDADPLSTPNAWCI